MTSAQSMQPGRTARRFAALQRLAILAALLPLAGCSSNEKLQDPVRLRSPYENAQVWAVAPFTNESGVSTVKIDQVADRFTEEVEQIEGVRAVPVNRVFSAMHQLQINGIHSPGDAIAVMSLLGVDGIIVGTVTAYDPYSPPRFGASIQLYRHDVWRGGGVNTVELTRAPTERISPGQLPSNAPAAQASGVFDAKDNQTLTQLQDYAKGRTEPGSAFGSRIYQADMDLYTQFAAYELLDELLSAERARQQEQATTQPAEKR